MEGGKPKLFELPLWDGLGQGSGKSRLLKPFALGGAKILVAVGERAQPAFGRQVRVGQ